MSGHESRAFLEAILANPDDDTPRLVYADWLEERGDGPRAEFIRVQCERARLPEWDARQVPLQLLEQALIAAHGERWKAELPVFQGFCWGHFRRGFVAEARLQSFGLLDGPARACWAVTPIEAVSAPWLGRRESVENIDPIPGLRELTISSWMVGWRQVHRLADAPLLSTLRALFLFGSDLGVEGFRWLLASPHLRGLRALSAPCNSIGNRGISALIDATSLSSLERLDLSRTGNHDRSAQDPTIDSHGVEALAAWPGMARLRSLNLSGNDVGRDGLRALLRSPHATGLKELALRGNLNDGWEFIGARQGVQLDVLDIGENLHLDLGLSHLASAACLRELKVLTLDRCELPPSAGRELAGADFLGTLRKLNLSNNRLGPRGLGALLYRHPRELHTLEMVDNALGDEGAVSLAASPATDGLLVLDLSGNDLGESSAQALAGSRFFRNLQVLSLYTNRFSKPVLDALKDSPLGKRLAVLASNPMGNEDDIPW